LCGGGGGGEFEKRENDEQIKRQTAKAREEKLQRDLFILKKLNTSFAAFNDVLKDTQTGAEVWFMLNLSVWGYLTRYIASR
jgi:hypothetical protein